MGNTLKSVPCEITIKRGVQVDIQDVNGIPISGFYLGEASRGIDITTASFFAVNTGSETATVQPVLKGDIVGFDAVFSPGWATLLPAEKQEFDLSIEYEPTAPLGLRQFSIDLEEFVPSS